LFWAGTIDWALERPESQAKKIRGGRFIDIKKYAFQIISVWILKVKIIYL
jgi:hypothetical protein